MTKTLNRLKADLLKGKKLEKEFDLSAKDYYSYNIQDLLSEIQDEIDQHPGSQKARLVKKTGEISEVFKSADVRGRPVIVILKIPKGAKRSQDIDDDYKCRASEARVLRIETMEGKRMKKETVASSRHDPKFKYKAGTTVRPEEDFDTSGKACASGIHFFMTRKDAENY